MTYTLWMLVLVLFVSPLQVVEAACCDWTDRQACATCPSGYYSGCRTERDKCNCDCEESADDLAAKLAEGNPEIRAYIEENFETIIEDTQQFGSHDGPSGVRISIQPH